jgi:uncharacterized protein YhfF
MSKAWVCEFGFPGPLRDRVVSSVLSGRKTATTSLLAEREAEGDELPTPDEEQTVIDSAGEPVATIEITRCEVRRIVDVDDVIRAEGEDYICRVAYRARAILARRGNHPVGGQ